MKNKEKIRNYISDNLVTFEDEVRFNDNDNIFELGIVDSLFAMKLINFVEKNFDIVIGFSDINIDNFSSIDNIAKLIQVK